MPSVEVSAAELSWRSHGNLGEPSVLAIHETGTCAAVWDQLGEALRDGMRLIAYDRRGWGESSLQGEYVATTINEQAADAAVVIEGLGLVRSVVCGAGLGAVVALALSLARPELVGGAVLIEPPLLAFSQEATEVLSHDRLALEAAVGDGGPDAALELFRSGELSGLGAGAERVPSDLCESEGEAAALFAELGAVPGWSIPFASLGEAITPTAIVISEGTPVLLVQAAEALAERLGGSELLRIPGSGPAHVDAGADAGVDAIGQVAAKLSELSPPGQPG